MIYLAALLALGTVPSDAQEPGAAMALQPAPDSAERRRALRELVMCVARVRPRWARQTLAHPYLSEAQAGAAAEALSGRDSCLQEDTDMTFRTSTLVGSAAEHFIQSQADQSSFARLAKALNTATPLNASEDFALCVAARNPIAARDLALSEPGSPVETRSAGQLADHVQPCTRPGENLTVDLQSLRALMGTALYRAMVPTLAARN